MSMSRRVVVLFLSWIGLLATLSEAATVSYEYDTMGRVIRAAASGGGGHF